MLAVRRPPTLAILAVAVGAVAELAGANVARAQGPRRPTEAEACFESAERAQPLLKSRKLRAAARELAVCEREVCPRAARSDCRAWLEELSRVQPTLVFRARESRSTRPPRPDGAGPGGTTDVAVDDVKVTIDGELLVQGIDETPVGVDPGPHTLRFEHAGFPAVEQRLELHEGEVRRIVDIVFRPADASPPLDAGVSATAPPPPAPGPVAPASAGNRAARASRELDGTDGHGADAPAPAATWVLLGSAGIALGLGAGFEAVGLTSRSHLESTCGPLRSCAPSDVDSARAQVLVGDIALGAGAALLAGALWVYLARGPAEAASLHLGVRPIAGGFAAALEGRL